jgi:thiamine-phosphate pyrophosphorylase
MQDDPRQRRQRLREARLYLVCEIRGDAFLDAALRGGVDIVQLRAKDADDATIVGAGRRFAARCAAHRALFILNDRPDLVAATGADGVHVGQDDIAVAEVRRRLGDETLVGLSTHTPAQVEAANGVAVAAAGARAIAVVRALTDAGDPEYAARALRARIAAEVDVART